MVSPNPPAPLSTDTMLPDLLRAHPGARRVFDRYGLSGCGGQHGPVESLGFFARTHGVDERRLLREIQTTVEAPQSDAEDNHPLAPSLADTIYRRFFLGGIAIILTAGAVWGAYLLWQIGIRGKFTGVSLQDVNAHGHAQIYGWVGLFMMGFACQAFPRIWHTTLAAPRLAVAAFGLMIAGLIVRTTGMTLADTFAHAPCLALLGGIAELAAILLFVGQIVATFRRSPSARMEPYVGFVMGALFWFVAMASMDLWYTYATMTAPDRDSLLWLVATYQAPLRDLQIHGLAMSMILGVSLRMLPPLFGVPATSDRRAWRGLALLQLAVVAEVVLFIAYRWTHNHVLAAFLLIPWLMIAASVLVVALPWRLWQPLPVQERSGKFVRAAYAWLALSLIMLLLLPVYQAASGIPFSHAYYGAIRHAITVGFISLMIMGFAAKVVPTLNGVDTRALTRLYGPFLLVNTGCFLRVSLQTLTDWHPGFFPLVGISGTLEVIGLAWWGGHLIRILRAGKRAELRATAAPAVAIRPAITPETCVADVVEAYPATLDVFAAHGFTLLRNRAARRTVGRGVTIAQAARFRAVCADDLLEQLRSAAGQDPATGGRACAGCDHTEESIEQQPVVVHP